VMCVCRYKIMGITLQRGILILLLTSFPIALVWWNVEVLLLALGQDPAIAKIANDYLRYLLPDLLATALLSPLRIFLRSQCIAKPMMVCSGLAMVLHVPINSLLVFGCGLGAPGTAVANFWTDVNMIVFLLIYIKYSGVCQYTWPGWSKACLHEWRPLLRLALPSCFMTCLEWWCYEIMMMLAGLLSDARKSIAIMAIVLNGDTILYALQVPIKINQSHAPKICTISLQQNRYQYSYKPSSHM
jgi:MATE family multidrug resistance protein